MCRHYDVSGPPGSPCGASTERHRSAGQHVAESASRRSRRCRAAPGRLSADEHTIIERYDDRDVSTPTGQHERQGFLDPMKETGQPAGDARVR
jgi:hypothetical protein